MALEVKETSGKLLGGGGYTTSFPTVSGQLSFTTEFAAGAKGANRPIKNTKRSRKLARGGLRRQSKPKLTIIG